MPTEYFKRSLGFLMHDVSRLLRRRFDERARALGLTRAQWRVMAYIGRQEGINQSALADILEVENITLGRHVDRLQEAGWVERRPDPADRRAWRLYLTEKAHPILARIRMLAIENREAALDGLSEKERDGLFEMLVAIKDNLLAMEPPARADTGDSGAPSRGRKRNVG